MYPRLLYKGKAKTLSVNSEHEEYKAGLDGWESHWNPEINNKRKGTDKEVLREFEIIDEREEPKEEPILMEEYEEELIDPVAEEVVEIVKKKRKRRTKTEIEADKNK